MQRQDAEADASITAGYIKAGGTARRVILTERPRGRFFLLPGRTSSVAVGTMRRILIDHTRARRRDKRGGDAVQVILHAIDARKADVVELSFYGGMTYDEIGEALQISPATVDRELRFAKAWLLRELKGDMQN